MSEHKILPCPQCGKTDLRRYVEPWERITDAVTGELINLQKVDDPDDRCGPFYVCGNCKETWVGGDYEGRLAWWEQIRQKAKERASFKP